MFTGMEPRLTESSSPPTRKGKGKGKVKPETPGKSTDMVGAGLQLATTSPSSKITGSTRNGEENDWVDSAISGGSVLLSIVREASSIAPVPYLKQAAGVTLKIVEIIQTVKENKAAFKRLAQQAMEFIVTVYSAYQRSANKAEWPPQELNIVIQEFLDTLKEILASIEHHLNRGKFKRFVYSAADVGKIEDFRQNIQAAVAKFEVASHLGLHEALSLVLKNQLKDEDARMQQQLLQAQHDIEEVHRQRLAQEYEAQLREAARRLQEEEDNRRRQQAIADADIIAQQRRIEELDAQNSVLRIQVADDLMRREEEEEAMRERERERVRQQQEDAEALERIRIEERVKIEVEYCLKARAESELARKAKRLQEALDREKRRREELEREYEEERRKAEEYAACVADSDSDASPESIGGASEYETEPETRPPPKPKVHKAPKPKTHKKPSHNNPSPTVESLGSQFSQTSLGYSGPYSPQWQYGAQQGFPFAGSPPPLSPPVYPNPYAPFSFFHQAAYSVGQPLPPSSSSTGPVTVHNVNSGNYSNVTITNSGNVPGKKRIKARSGSSKKVVKNPAGVSP